MAAPKSVFKEGLIDQAKSDFNFLALNVLFSQLSQERKFTILDMGAASSANIDFFSHYQCKIFIEDFYHTYTKALSKDPETDITEIIQPYGANTKFDIILFWDLFDYVQPDQLKKLVKHLNRFCREGTMLFFITSVMENIPEQPAQFKIFDKQNLVYVNKSPTTRKSHGYKQSVYRTLLPGFKLYRGFRMSSGMEENLFVYGQK